VSAAWFRNGRPMASFISVAADSRPFGCNRATAAGTWPRNAAAPDCWATLVKIVALDTAKPMPIVSKVFLIKAVGLRVRIGHQGKLGTGR
jgi:hypothetical protein